jgi:hypothetical protein
LAEQGTSWRSPVLPRRSPLARAGT